MAKSQDGSSYWAELASFTLYKRNQGRLVRQMTAVTLCVLIFFGAYTLSKGPLSGYVSSYLRVTARYSSGTPNQQQNGELEQMAAKLGGQLAETRSGSRYQELVFDFPTSSGWTTDQKLVQQMRENSTKLAEQVTARYGSKVRLSAPRSQTRRAAWISIGIPVVVCLLGVWMVFRGVNYPRFADFLISVEAEMDKVTWPGKPELYRSTAVVVSVMFLLGFLLLAFDIGWKSFFEFIGFLRVPKSDDSTALLSQIAEWLQS